MVLTLLTTNDNIVTGIGGTSGHYCVNSSCQLLDHDDCSDAALGTISNQTMNVILTSLFIDGPCRGDVNQYSIKATNFGTYMTGTMTQLGEGGTGHIFLVKYASNPANQLVTSTKTLNEEFDLVFFGSVHSNYVFQTSTNLALWSTVSSFTCTNSPMIVSDKSAIKGPKRYYRIIPEA